MDAFSSKIDAAVASNDYSSLSAAFSSINVLGQGEQRSLCGYFINAAVSTPDFLPNAFKSGECMHCMTLALSNLPTSVKNAADSTLRQMLFDYYVNEEEDFSGAARVLGGMRMESTPESVYFKTAAEMCDGEFADNILSGIFVSAASIAHSLAQFTSISPSVS